MSRRGGHLGISLSGDDVPDVGVRGHSAHMQRRRRLSGTELLYALTLYLHQHGPTRVDELIEAMDRQGFEIAGRPSKSVSDALRWEVQRDRVRRLKRGRYGPGFMPRSTEHRIHARVLQLREEAAALNAATSEAFWDALGG